jgi:hypothetical protein
MNHRILHIVPKKDNTVCGVWDYANAIGSKIASSYYQLSSTDIEDNLGYSNELHWKNTLRTANCVVLHYSGYGYATNGAPNRLADFCEKRPSDVRLVTFFHELYSPCCLPWRRSFWHSFQQKKVAVRIARTSCALISNRELSSKWLSHTCRDLKKPIFNLPVCSNIGESTNFPDFSTRKAYAVMFGKKHFKSAFLNRRNRSRIVQILKKIGISKIVNIGQPLAESQIVNESSKIQIENTGFLDAESVKEKLELAKVGLFAYYQNYFAKSGVLAAYAACGTPVLTLRPELFDGLNGNIGLQTISEMYSATPETLRSWLPCASKAIWTWGQGHNVSEHAKVLRRAIDQLHQSNPL